MTKDTTINLINKIKKYKNHINEIPEKDQETFKNLYKTLINVLKKTNSMSGGVKEHQHVWGSDGKCIICKRPLRSRRSRSRRRPLQKTGPKSTKKALRTKLKIYGDRTRASDRLVQAAQQLAVDLNPTVPGDREDLYQLAVNIFQRAANELIQSSNFQNKDRELWFYNLYLYVIIPFSCLLCTSVQGYLWYNFISTFIWIIEENTAAVEYQSGVEGRRTEDLNQERISHAFRTEVEKFRQANIAEQQQQRLTWLQTIRTYLPEYLPGTTQEQMATIEEATVAPPPAPETASTSSFTQWGHDVAHSMKNWFINKKYDIQNNFVIQLMAQFGLLARETGNFVYMFPLVTSIYVIKKHIDWARRVMKEHPTYIETGDPPRKGPPKDPRDPRGDGSGSSPGITAGINAGGKRRKSRKRRKRTRKRSRNLIHKLFRLAGGKRRKRKRKTKRKR